MIIVHYRLLIKQINREMLSERIFMTNKPNFFKDLLPRQSDDSHSKVWESIYHQHCHSKQPPHKGDRRKTMKWNLWETEQAAIRLSVSWQVSHRVELLLTSLMLETSSAKREPPWRWSLAVNAMILLPKMPHAISYFHPKIQGCSHWEVSCSFIREFNL